MIRAECHSDDHAKSAEFDATPYFAVITPDEFQKLIDCDFGGDYPADEVAQFFSDKPGYGTVREMFDYLGTGPKMLNGDTVGFECYVNEQDVAAWAETARPELFVMLQDRLSNPAP